MLSRKENLFIAVIISIAFILSSYYWFFVSQTPIYEYNPEQDRAALCDIFNQNFYWLTTETDEGKALLSFERNLDTRSSSSQWMDQGNLKVKVYRVDGCVAGFVAYHKVSGLLAKILYIAVHDDYRRRGYAEFLLQHAFDDLRSQGFTRVELVTRVVNKHAQGLYKKFGFKSTWDDGELIGFARNL